MSRTLLSLDLSTSCTGWAKFDINSKKLLEFGIIEPNFKNPKTKGVFRYAYPQLQVKKLKELSLQVIDLIDDSVEMIAIEEINSGKNRLGQKVLDGFHFMLLQNMSDEALSRVFFYDSDGKTGWRSVQGLNLTLSSQERLLNKERKKLNKKIGRGQKKLALITQKTLSCHFVNKFYKLNLDCELETTDGDKADAIGLGHFVLYKVLK